MKKDVIDRPRRGCGCARFEVRAREVIEKQVRPSGNRSKSGRIYLPNEWIGCTVKIVRIN